MQNECRIPSTSKVPSFLIGGPCYCNIPITLIARYRFPPLGEETSSLILNRRLVLRPFQCLLLSDGAVPVFAATLKEAMMHHALAYQKKDHRQHDYKQELSNSERGWLSSGRGRDIHFISSLRLL